MGGHAGHFGPRSKQATRICRGCDRQRKSECFGSMPHAADGSGLNPNCRECVGRILRAARSGEVATDEEVNSVLAVELVAADDQLENAVKAVVAAMKATNANRVEVLVSSTMAWTTVERSD